MVMSSVGQDMGQRNRACPAEIGTVGTYASGWFKTDL